MPKVIEKERQVPVIRDSAHQIWLAGLGALSLAEDQSGKLFKALVKRGKGFEDATKDRIDEVRAKLDVRKAANNVVDRISDTFDDSVNGVLVRLGIPSKKEIEGLTKRVERLTKTIEETPAKRIPRRATTKRRAAHSATA